ncbi:MAG TPA: arsenate reductase ArsC [Nitrospiraceae bacterium]|nr:arsenate reductase ArsC [Nitrospiraceae bacterium]
MSSLPQLIGSPPNRTPGPYRLLFICTGNACRSPMAEGFARHYGMGRIDAYSAGVAPSPLNARAVRVMAELNIDIATHTHRSLEAVPIDQMDLVVTLCDYAQARSPRGPSGQHRLHWDIADPTALWGPDWLVLRAYRNVRDELDRRIRHLLRAVLK